MSCSYQERDAETQQVLGTENGTPLGVALKGQGAAIVREAKDLEALESKAKARLLGGS